MRRPSAGTAVSSGHCTSVTRPDGREGNHAADGGKQTINHVYVTFTVAKERIVYA